MLLQGRAIEESAFGVLWNLLFGFEKSLCLRNLVSVLLHRDCNIVKREQRAIVRNRT